LFATNGFAINVNRITIYPNVFGTAVDYILLADVTEDPIESEAPKEYTRTYPHNLTVNKIVSSIQAGATRAQILSTAKPAPQTIFRFTTADIQPQSKGFSVFPITNTLVISWDADVDFVIEFDFTVLPIHMNLRSEVMDLLENRRQVEDPSVSNVDGKRVLPRAPLLVLEE